jgi:hypothetical protein
MEELFVAESLFKTWKLEWTSFSEFCDGGDDELLGLRVA